jgi:hypothetical protein
LLYLAIPIAWSLMPVLMAVQGSLWSAIGMSVLALALFGSWFALERLERKFYAGQITPPRNLPNPKKKR